MTPMVPSDWRDGFLFVGNQLALDFVNTRPIQDEEEIELIPDVEALLRWFRAAGLLDASQLKTLRKRYSASMKASGTFKRMLEFRETLRKAVFSWESSGSIGRDFVAELNGLMASHPMRLRLHRNAGGFSTDSWFSLREPEDLISPIAQAAAKLFSTSDHNRVRKCEHCILHFHDTSKIGTRRWCSMRICGNRAKVAAYAARRRDQKPGEN